MTRQRLALRRPRPGEAAALPAFPLPCEVARAVDTRRTSPWWFSSRTQRPEMAGRFDLEWPRGTCYLADDPVGALAEKLRDPDDLEPVVTFAALDRVAVWAGELRQGDLADTTARRSRMSKELGTVTPYTLPWAWADACDAEGRDGLVAWLRLDPGPGRGVARFGSASTAEAPNPDGRTELTARRPAIEWLVEITDLLDVVDVPAQRDLEAHPGV